MGLRQINYWLILVLSLWLFIGPSASTFIADAVFGSQDSIGRRLLQKLKPCPVNLKSLNYTIMKSKCKAPNYLPGPCCSAFKELACPIVDQLDDLETDCAGVLFKNINDAGGYPDGLFSSFCKEGEEGLACPVASSPAPISHAKKAVATQKLSLLLLLLIFTSTSLLSWQLM